MMMLLIDENHTIPFVLSRRSRIEGWAKPAGFLGKECQKQTCGAIWIAPYGTTGFGLITVISEFTLWEV
jgi:hypothetical protein